MNESILHNINTMNTTDRYLAPTQNGYAGYDGYWIKYISAVVNMSLRVFQTKRYYVLSFSLIPYSIFHPFSTLSPSSPIHSLVRHRAYPFPRVLRQPSQSNSFTGKNVIPSGNGLAREGITASYPHCFPSPYKNPG